MLIVVLCLLLDVRVTLDPEVQVDLLETNTYLAANETPMTQVIAWNWCPEKKRYMVAGWTMKSPVQGSDGRYWANWSRCRVVSRQHQRTWTLEDREAENWKKHGRDNRDSRLNY